MADNRKMRETIKTQITSLRKQMHKGTKRPGFIPVPAFQTADAMDSLYQSFQNAWQENIIDKLLLTPMFILDFLCIHPFNDGNGRMSRLLTLLLLYRASYIVGKYISLEMLIEKTNPLTL
ncbi:Fic family protein [Mitsuokella multacida]|uniref:Fic family protein n=1 Tax=Mitsuokella multacida TaxID=52226 RepID=UPI0031333B9A